MTDKTQREKDRKTLRDHAATHEGSFRSLLLDNQFQIIDLLEELVENTNQSLPETGPL